MVYGAYNYSYIMGLINHLTGGRHIVEPLVFSGETEARVPLQDGLC